MALARLISSRNQRAISAGLSPAREIIKEVATATATATWRDVANEMGVRTAEINRMASAFEHDDLEQAQTL